jgi:carbohydrate diacid regulator
MNYAQAAKVLFVHKNTIVFRMNKLKSILGIDPYANQDHLALFSYLYYYISLDNHTLLSFQKEYDKYRS